MAKIQPSTRRVFAAEHQRLDEMLAQVERAWADGNAELGAELYARVARNLERHMAVESRYLFAAVREHGDAAAIALVASLDVEHAEIARRLADVSGHVDALAPSVGAELEALAALVRAHELREEERLFPACDTFVDPGVRATAARELDRLVSGPPSRSRGPLED